MKFPPLPSHLYVSSKFPLEIYSRQPVRYYPPAGRTTDDNGAEKIKEFREMLRQPDTIAVCSLYTPAEGLLPYSFNMVFNYDDLEETEHADVTVRFIIERRSYLFEEFIYGHTVEAFLEVKRSSSLIERLETTFDGKQRIGFCNRDSWEEIKAGHARSKQENEHLL